MKKPRKVPGTTAMYDENALDYNIALAKVKILNQIIQSLGDLHDTLFKTIAGNETLAMLEQHLVNERTQFALLRKQVHEKRDLFAKSLL